MVEKRSKYDTDPLDPEFVRRTEEIAGKTREIGSERTVLDEANRPNTLADPPTRRYEQPVVDTAAPPPFAVHTAPDFSAPARNETRVMPLSDPFVPLASTGRVQKINLPENVACALPYLPFYIGLIISLVELVVVPRNESRTRFHAAQSLALHAAIFLINHVVFRTAYFLTSRTMGSFPTSLLWFIWSVFSLGSLAYLIYLTVRVWQNNNEVLPPLAEPVKWLNDHIEPRK